MQRVDVAEKCTDGAWMRYSSFFFSSRRRHTRLQGDWSSDVCSSDLVAATRHQRSASRADFVARAQDVAALLGASRPTAVNLRWALARMLRVAEETPGEGSDLWERLRAEATAIWEEDRAMCRRIGEHGLTLLADGANVLTHCNTGALATGGIGTALAPIYLAHEQGRKVHVYVDETRPLLQGSRLTTWEIGRAHV